MSAQSRRFLGGVGHGGLAAVVPAENLISRAGETGVVVGVCVGENQQKPLLLPRPAQKPVHCPQGKAVPVPPGSGERKYQMCIRDRQKPVVQQYVMDQIFDAMENEEAWIAPYYAGDYLTMVEENPDLAFYRPTAQGYNMFIRCV